MNSSPIANAEAELQEQEHELSRLYLLVRRYPHDPDLGEAQEEKLRQLRGTQEKVQLLCDSRES